MTEPVQSCSAGSARETCSHCNGCGYEVPQVGRICSSCDGSGAIAIRCACVHDDARQCIAIRYGRRAEFMEMCDCDCHGDLEEDDDDF